MSELRICVEPHASPEDRRQVEAGLIAFNAARGNLLQVPALTVLLRDAAGAIHGGLLGAMLWTWLYVDVLWVADAQRGAGHGSRLLEAAEDEAKRMGCRPRTWTRSGSRRAPSTRSTATRCLVRWMITPRGNHAISWWKQLAASPRV